MTFTKVKDYNGKTGKVYNEEFEVQILPDERKYLVNWNALTNPQEDTYRIVKENLSKAKALATHITNSGLLYLLKESYETQLDPRAFDESTPPLRSLSQLFS